MQARDDVVIPAQAGMQAAVASMDDWIPACAGMTEWRGNDGMKEVGFPPARE